MMRKPCFVTSQSKVFFILTSVKASQLSRNAENIISQEQRFCQVEINKKINKITSQKQLFFVQNNNEKNLKKLLTNQAFRCIIKSEKQKKRSSDSKE